MEARRQIATYYVLHDQFESALQELMKFMERNQYYDDNYAQKAMLNVFSILGREHELVFKYRVHLRRYSH